MNSNYTGVQVESILDSMSRNMGFNMISSLSNIPVNKQSVYAGLSENSVFSLAADMGEGECINIICGVSFTGTIAIPNSTPYFFSMSGSSIDVVPGDMFEINVWRINTVYIIAFKKRTT